MSYRFMWTILSILVLFGCSERAITTTFKKTDSGITTVSTSASNSMSITRSSNANEKICVRLGPDTSFNSDNRINVSLFGRSEQAASGETEGELIGRTPTVLFMRDVAYGLCIANLNETISDEEYIEALREFYSMGMNILSEEVKNELITISEKSATPNANLGGLETATTISAKTKTLDCSELSGGLKLKYLNFKKSDDFDETATYDCGNMSAEKKIFKPMVVN